MNYRYEWGYGMCSALDTNCQLWNGTYCEMDKFWEEVHCVITTEQKTIREVE